MTKVLLPILFLCVLSNVQAQSGSTHRLNESFRNTPLQRVLTTIQKKYDVSFSYRDALVRNIVLTIELKDVDVKEGIERILKQTPLTFTIVGNNYVIIPRPQEEEKPRIERTNITISGNVTDADNDETLPEATIRIKNTTITTTSNNDGYFSLLDVPSDTCVIEIMYLGYLNHTIRIKDIDDISNCRIRLKSDTRMLNEVIVLGEHNHAIHVESLPGALVFNPKSVANLPSLGEQDMSRTLQLLPGVSATDESSSGMIIRGSHSSYNLTLLDGMTIYQQDHFFGAFSIINADIIKDVRVHKGMFDAKYGGRASGVIDITTKNGNSVRPSFNAKMNTMNLKASAEIPLGKKLSLYTAGRRSFTDIVQSKLFTTLFDIASISNDQIRFLSYEIGQELPTYYFADINSKLTYRPTERDVFSLSFYNGRDKMHNNDSLSISEETEKYVDQREETTKWGNNGLSLRWARQWNEHYYSNFRVSYSKFFRRYDNDSRTEFKSDTDSMLVIYGLDFDNSISDISYGVNNEWLVNNKLSVDIGIEGTRQTMNAHVADKYFYLGSFPVDDDTEVDITEKSQSWLHAIYASSNISLLERWNVVLGARVAHYYNKTGRIYFEPRISLYYQIQDNINLKGGYGRSNQFVTQQFNYSVKGSMSGLSENFWILADPGDIRYPVITSDHVTAGTTLKVRQLVFDVEGYYKFNKGVIIDDNFNSANTTAYGVDFMIQKKGGIHTGWIAYSIGRGTQTHPYILNGRSAPTWQDQRHEFKMVNMLMFGRWNFSSTIVYGSGKPYPKYNVNYYRDENGFIDDVVPVLDYSNTSRLPAYFSLDIAACYKLLIGKNRELELGLSIHNLTDHKNIKTRRINKERFSEAELTNTELPATYNDILLLGFSPSLFINFSF